MNVKVDISKAQEALSGTSKSLKSIQKQVLGIYGKNIVKSIKNAIALSDLQKRTGELLKCYRYKVKKTGEEANVFPKALNGERTIFPKVMSLSYGVQKGKRKIKAFKFVQAGQEFLENGDLDDEIQKIINKELDKYWS